MIVEQWPWPVTPDERRWLDALVGALTTVFLEVGPALARLDAAIRHEVASAPTFTCLILLAEAARVAQDLAEDVYAKSYTARVCFGDLVRACESMDRKYAPSGVEWASVYCGFQRPNYPVHLLPTSTGFSAHVPWLPGVVAAGETREETLRLIQEAITLHIAAALNPQSSPGADENE